MVVDSEGVFALETKRLSREGREDGLAEGFDVGWRNLEDDDTEILAIHREDL